MAMDWDKLRIFHMVAEAGSFTHAGESLGLSQSAVSRHISSFEEGLGIPLFHRHARGLILTEQGEMLHKASTEIFSKMVMIEGQLSDTKNQSEGELTLTLAEFVGTHWLASRLPAFRTQYPDIQMSILLDDRIFNLGMREADAAIRLYKPDQPDLIHRHLATLRFVVCASKSYLAERGTPTGLGQLKDHTLIGYPDNILVPYQNPNWLFTKAHINRTKNSNLLLMNSVSTIHQAIRSGAGIGVLPLFMVQNSPEIEPILPNIEPDSVDMYFVYPEERRHSKRISIFRDFILDQIKRTEF